ncbi:MAG: hypothetical protein AAFZ52_09000, partial [Bacteroidota bacterium]
MDHALYLPQNPRDMLQALPAATWPPARTLFYPLLLLFLLLAGGLSAQGSCSVDGGTLVLPNGDDFLFTCADDGVSDAFTPEVTGAVGDNFVWVITSPAGFILGLPPGPTFDLEGVGPGTCFLYQIAYSDGFTGGLELGDNICELTEDDGCFDISNHISVVRRTGDDCMQSCNALSSGIAFADGSESATICVDGIPDPLEVVMSGEFRGDNTGFLITNAVGEILDLPNHNGPFDLDGAGPGTCVIWYIAFEDGLTGLAVGQNTDDLDGCFDLSNSLVVERNEPSGGTLSGGPFEFTVDGTPDMIPEGAITVDGSQGENFQWIVTDDAGNILGLPPTFSAPNFDGAGPGTCRVYYLGYYGEVSGLARGANIDDIMGCFGLSNAIDVVRTRPGDCQANGGELFGGPFAFTAGDGQADMIPEGAITVANSQGENFQWIVTDAAGNILGLPPTFSVVDFDGAGAGNCLVWYSRFDGEITGLEVGLNANDIQGCFALSNAIEVVRTVPGDCQVNGGEIFGGPFSFTAGDGEPDIIPAGSITVANSQGENFQWIVTDANGIILGLPPMPSAVNFDGAGAGNCLVWYSRFDGEITGLEVGL